MQSEEDSQWLQQAEKRLSAGKLDPTEQEFQTQDDRQVTAGHKIGSQEDSNLVTAPPDVVNKGLRDRSATPMTSSSSEDVGGRAAVGKVNY